MNRGGRQRQERRILALMIRIPHLETHLHRLKCSSKIRCVVWAQGILPARTCPQQQDAAIPHPLCDDLCLVLAYILHRKIRNQENIQLIELIFRIRQIIDRQNHASCPENTVIDPDIIQIAERLRMVGNDTDDKLCIRACNIEADTPGTQRMPLPILRGHQQLTDTGAE